MGSHYQDMISGPELDSVIAQKFMRSAVRRFSTDEDFTAEVCFELKRRGYDFELDDGEGVVTCSISKGSDPRKVVSGKTYEEALCRAVLKMLGNDSG